MNMLFDIQEIIVTLGYLGIYSIVFAESGLFFGFFLPGDSLLVTAGLLASQNVFSIYNLLVFTPIAAILGDSIGYWMGNKFGTKIFTRKESIIRKPRHLQKAKRFYKKHGKKTIVLARFLPIIRTFAPIVAGMAKMEYKEFVKYNILGGLFWTWATLLIGYFLGMSIPNVENYILPIVVVIVILSFVPPTIERWK